MNNLRATKGLAPMVIDGNLIKVGYAQSTYQSSIGQMTHSNSNYPGLFERFAASGVTYCSGIAENVAWGTSDPTAVFNLWKNSPPHLASMMGNYSKMGVAIYNKYSSQAFCR